MYLAGALVQLGSPAQPHVFRTALSSGGFCGVCGGGPNDWIHDGGPLLPLPAWRRDRDDEVVVNRLVYPRPLRLGV